MQDERIGPWFNKCLVPNGSMAVCLQVILDNNKACLSYETNKEEPKEHDFISGATEL